MIESSRKITWCFSNVVVDLTLKNMEDDDKDLEECIS